MLLNLKNTIHTKKNDFAAGLPVPAFNPIDSNTIALWDGDIALDGNTNWTDVIAGYKINFFNSPTVDMAGLNGHGTVTFNGTTQNGICITPAISIPSTIYLVINLITWTANRRLIDDGLNTGSNALRCFGSSTNLDYDLGSVQSNPDLTLNSFGILTLIKEATQSSIRTNLFPIVNGTALPATGDGITLASTASSTFLSNISFAYIIIRNKLDSTFLQNNFIGYLKNRFAI